MRALFKNMNFHFPTPILQLRIRAWVKSTMTKTKNEQPKVPEKPSHLSAEQDTRNRSPDNTSPAIPTEQRPYEAATHSPTASDASGSHTTGNSSQDTASTPPNLASFIATLKKSFVGPRHLVSPLYMAFYCAMSIVLTIAVYQTITYLTKSRLTSTLLIVLALPFFSTTDPHNIVSNLLYFTGRGIAFVSSNLTSGFTDGPNSTLSLRRKIASQDATLQAITEIRMQIPRLFTLAKEHTARPEDISALDKVAKGIEVYLDDLFDLAAFDLTRLNADTKNDRGQNPTFSTRLGKENPGAAKSPQTPANKSAGAAQWF